MVGESILYFPLGYLGLNCHSIELETRRRVANFLPDSSHALENGTDIQLLRFSISRHWNPWPREQALNCSIAGIGVERYIKPPIQLIVWV